MSRLHEYDWIFYVVGWYSYLSQFGVIGVWIDLDTIWAFIFAYR